MLYECNYPRLLILKYLPLMGVFIMLSFVRQVIVSGPYPLAELLSVIVFPLLITVALFILFFSKTKKLKYVAIGKTKVIVGKGKKEIEYNWLDIEKISLNRFLGIYELKIKSEEVIYFTPYGMITWLTGDNSEMGVIINKMKKELQI